jgi:flagellar motor switch protein FliM
MPELEQRDIDALLNAVSTGQVRPEQRPGQIFSRHRRGLEEIEIREYDFKRPERISKDQIRALHALHETFARSFGASLSGMLRSIVEVRVAHVEQMTYGEFIAALPNPTSFSLVHPPPLEGQMCLEVSPLIIYPLIDRLLGGSNTDLFIPQRSMTLIETRLIQKILQKAEAWEGVKRIDFRLGEMESNPQLVQIVPPNEVVVVLGFEIKMTSRAGTMSLCIPYNVIEPIVEDLNAQSWFASGKSRGDPEREQQMVGRLRDAGLEATGILARTTMTLSELRNLEVGDLIMTDKPVTAPVVLSVEGVPKFLATIGQHKGKRALRIARPIAESDRF